MSEKEKKEPQYVELKATLTLTPEAFFGVKDNVESQPAPTQSEIHTNVKTVNSGLLNLLHPIRDSKFDNYEEK